MKKMKKRKQISTKKRTILLGDDVFIEDGDEYKGYRSEYDIWRPVTAEDIGITVGDSRYHLVRRTILLGDDVFIKDGDEYYYADRSENDNWRPVTAEDIGITVGDSGYHSVRRPTKPMKGRKGLHQWTESARPT